MKVHSFGDPNQIDVCGDTLDKIFYYKVTFHNDRTAEFRGRLNCGSGFGATGKYYVNEDEIVIIDKDCDGTYMCSEYEIIHYEGDKLSVHNSYMGKQYTLELIKE